MVPFILRRLLSLIPTVLIAFTLTFLVVHATPGSPWDESEKPLPEAVKQNLRKQYHLDDPLPKQYFDYLASALHGDFGPSYRNVLSVSEIIQNELPISIQLGLASLAFALVVGIPLGTLAAMKQNTWIDFAASLLTVTGVATPPFVRVSLLIVLFSLTLHWLPTGGWNGLFDGRIIIPMIAIGSGPAAILARYMRSSLLEVLNQDYIRTARAKGMSERRVVYLHGLRNALIPLITLIGLELPGLVSGGLVVEVVFGWPGIGKLAFERALQYDYTTVMGVTFFATLLVVAGNLIADVLYGILDPRIRLA